MILSRPSIRFLVFVSLLLSFITLGETFVLSFSVSEPKRIHVLARTRRKSLASLVLLERRIPGDANDANDPDLDDLAPREFTQRRRCFALRLQFLSPQRLTLFSVLFPFAPFKAPVNLKRDSILFSENPSTLKRNNPAQDTWQLAKRYLPAVITGAWSWRSADLADQNPVGALYNLAFVRIPMCCVGVVYISNLFQKHPLVMDVGDGPFVMSPLVVVAVLAFILA